MSKVRNLIDRLASHEEASRSSPFVAPAVPNGRVRVRIEGLLHTYTPDPPDFQGWGVFLAEDERKACLMEEADPPQIDGYLSRLPRLRLLLSRALAAQTWLSVPANRSDARQRLGRDHPMVVRLVTRGQPFDRVLARCDGLFWWFEALDRRADPLESAALREALESAEVSDPEGLRRPGLTPEMKEAFRLAAAPDLPDLEGWGPPRHRGMRPEEDDKAVEDEPEPSRIDPDEARLSDVLARSGGRLHGYQDRGDHFWVEWSTADGRVRHSAVARNDLTVITAGICLDDMDRHFDLQSLVGVMEGVTDYLG